MLHRHHLSRWTCQENIKGTQSKNFRAARQLAPHIFFFCFERPIFQHFYFNLPCHHQIATFCSPQPCRCWVCVVGVGGEVMVSGCVLLLGEWMGGWSRWRRLALPWQAVMAAFSARAACLKSGKPPRKKFLALPTCARGVSTLKPPIKCLLYVLLHNKLLLL